MSKTSLRDATLVLALAVSLTACSSDPTESKRDSSGAITEANDAASVFDMQVGDCFNTEGSESTASTLPAVPCDSEHFLEAYHEFLVEDGAFPGDDSLAAQGEANCREAFTAFVGIAAVSSSLDFTFFAPTPESWENNGDRTITCLIGDPAGLTRGSLAGAGR